MEDNFKVAINSMKETKVKLEKQKKDINHQIKEIDNTLDIMYKVNNVCPFCDGTGETFDREGMMNDNDPYSRSSDFKHTCVRCNGTGKYNL